ncbi:MAG: hypothetical protein IJM79_07925 [Erysipelotrichaceae bacterium]|nr:hypothetical protein [Erysipelotrichaceae bacterium]
MKRKNSLFVSRKETVNESFVSRRQTIEYYRHLTANISLLEIQRQSRLR